MRRTATVEVIRMSEQDWERLRDLRLEMLVDSPQAYVEPLASAQAADEAEWRFRARRASFPGSVGLVAPDYRGREQGVADAMLDAVEAWAVTEGRKELFLEVHEDNGRAQAFYLRRGYEFTGSTRPYDLDGSERELEMRRELPPAG